ncbi:hypothetical protein F5148DRAFT_1281612 [Russula earlei]|uniref:Uncharacterized protein n=1 Tax=Russula earlei TaxID=71964 RepID=A0ACC0UIT0_9AGAM|nr:hypothetical protein F5148DRAFT_1281612 [Russula earlei]
MTSIQPIAERVDIHKAGRALEAIVNFLDDYSEAARAVVTLHKRLAKALRDVAAVKPTEQVPGNAFSASATIFEVLSDVDAKFSKFVDKECDVINGEVKKWFKKLAKEEKAHDERIANANAKIKQAGQLYEKKAKRNAIDAPEEHNRYINLLNTLGPEISQTKYDHALAVSQRNSAVTFQVAATLSRVAEAEWLRTTESIRRFSPLIGQLGEWKALCEGGWAGPLPGNLPDVDPMPDPSWGVQEAGPNAGEFGLSPTPPRPLPVPTASTTASLKPPPAVYDDGSVRSIASLGSFPEPPNHFPIPPLTTSFSSNSATSSHHSAPVWQGDGPSQSRTFSDVSGSASGPPVALPGVTGSPIEEKANQALTMSQGQPMTPPSVPDGTNEVSLTAAERLGPNSDDPDESRDAPSPPVSNAELPRTLLPASTSTSPLLPVPRTTQRPQAEPSPAINSRASTSTGASSTFRRGDYLDNREFGVDNDNSTETAQLGEKTLDSAPQRRIEGSDATKGNGGVVATIRDKYTRATGPSSLPPRDVPRLPLSVVTIANRYQAENSDETATSSRWQARSPANQLPHRPRDPAPISPQTQQTQQFPSIAPGRTESPTDELVRRRQRVEELEELERRERALELRAREREFEFEALQRERAGNLRSDAVDGYGSESSRPNRAVPTSEPWSQAKQRQSQPSAPSLASGRSYSTTSLLPPGASIPAASAVQRATKDVHLPDCQCPACTVARYAEKPLTTRLRPQERERSKGGWMRRLSMPVVSNAFSSETKKGGAIGGKGAVPKILGSLGEANLSAVSLGRR